MALPKSHRLSLRFERDRLSQSGKTINGRFFTLVSAPGVTPNPRLAILLSKKTANLAVDRNNIKRTTSAVIESLLSSISPQDYLVIPKRQVLTTVFSELQKDFKEILLKIDN
jgi:ribonuclease P protein component